MTSSDRTLNDGIPPSPEQKAVRTVSLPLAKLTYREATFEIATQDTVDANCTVDETSR
jgi:hypothetical protein